MRFSNPVDSILKRGVLLHFFISSSRLSYIVILLSLISLRNISLLIRLPYASFLSHLIYRLTALISLLVDNVWSVHYLSWSVRRFVYYK